MNNPLNQIEETLQVTFKELRWDEPFRGNAYRSDGRGRIEELCLSNQNLEDFAALVPIFNDLRKLSLIDCVVTNASAFHELKKLRNLYLERTSVIIHSEVKRKSDFYLSSLELKETPMSSFDAF